MSRSRTIAMWSGPRNISTAMMRSFGNRPDTFVSDEPLYANFLVRTGVDHPMRDEVIKSMESDWLKLTSYLSGDIPNKKGVWYQKHMTHHYQDGHELGWIDAFTNCFLVRHPARVILSYLKIFEIDSSDLLGFRQQKEIFDYVQKRNGSVPVVIDANDIARDPDRMLTLLCERIGIDFSRQMVSWPVGAREYDGIWTSYWYKNVNKSDGFIFNDSPVPDVPEKYSKIYEECLEYYSYLYEYRIR